MIRISHNMGVYLSRTHPDPTTLILPLLYKLLSVCINQKILMKIVWGLTFTFLTVTIIIVISFTPDEVAENSILLGIGTALAAMCIAILAFFYMAVVSQD